MYLNERKSIRLRNRTKSFNPYICRTHNTFGSQKSYQAVVSKREGYEARLYWEYRYCEEHNGQAYFYTLTYNDEHVPTYEGHNCFDYEDLRWLLNGGFKKKLLRTYGTAFKYFVGAELGDGKGERGLANNPHYHVIFFLRDAEDPRYPYVKILPEQFRHLVKTYWQGFDEYTDGYHDYKTARYGIAKEGDNLGRITDFRACMYCAKYVVKDAGLKQLESTIIAKTIFKYRKYYEGKDFVVCDWFTQWFERNALGKSDYEAYFLPRFMEKPGFTRDAKRIREFMDDFPLTKIDFSKYLSMRIEDSVQDELRIFRNRYCNKCRISQGVGDYALDHITDLTNPTIPVPSKKGFKQRPINLYYYRKLFTDVVKDEDGNQARVINSLGIEYKMAHIKEQIQKKADKLYAQVKTVVDNEDLFNKMIQSDCNEAVNFDYDHFKYMLRTQLEYKDLKSIVYDYATYKLVYEDRFFKVRTDRDTGECIIPPISVVDDYNRFLQPSFGTVPYSDGSLEYFLEAHSENWIPYFAHPYFYSYSGLFRVFDLCADYFFVQGDCKRQKEAEEVARVKRFHDQRKLTSFYANFIN